MADSAAIDGADSVTPRRVNQQTFIFLQEGKAGKIVNRPEDKGDEEGRKTSREEVRPTPPPATPRRESADEHRE